MKPGEIPFSWRIGNNWLMSNEKMEPLPPKLLTLLLQEWSKGDRQALDDLMALAYQELKNLADAYLRSERPDHTLQPTALIHELYLRLLKHQMPEWENRSHFYGVAARMMRQILVDHARGKSAQRRGGPKQTRIILDESHVFNQDEATELIAFDEALEKLGAMDERKALIIEMRCFGGMSVSETAEALKISEPTVKREIRTAKAWLLWQLRS